MRRRSSGEGGVYERKDHRWEGQLHLGYDSGRRRRKSFYGATRAEVLAKMRTASRALELGQQPVPERETVADFLNRWLEDTARLTVRPSTHQGYEVVLRKHVLPVIGQQKLARLTADDLDRCYSGLLDKGLAPKTIRLCHAVVRRGLAHAQKRGAVAVNVASIAEVPAAPRKEFRVLSPAEASQLLEAASGDRLRGLYHLAVTCGLRQGELVGLRWRDVDLDGSVLHARQQAYRLGGEWVYSAPKTAAGRRSVALSATCVEALRERKIIQVEERLRAKDWEGGELVFTTPLGGPIEKSSLLRHSFAPLLKRAGLPRIRFHDLRHACASLLLAEGIHPKVVQERLGHASISTTMDTYSHVMPSLQADAAEKMDRLLAAQGQ